MRGIALAILAVGFMSVATKDQLAFKEDACAVAGFTLAVFALVFIIAGA